jgi:hypothetical protein
LQELVADPEENDALLRLGLQRLPAREFPLIHSLAAVLVDYDGAAECDRGLDILLTGLLRQVGTPHDMPIQPPDAHGKSAPYRLPS